MWKNQYGSTNANDALVPKGEVCDACHSTDHADLTHVKPGEDATGQCRYCHLGYKPQDGKDDPNVLAAWNDMNTMRRSQ